MHDTITAVLSRRTLLVAGSAGVGLALAGCSREGEQGAGAATGSFDVTQFGGIGDGRTDCAAAVKAAAAACSAAGGGDVHFSPGTWLLGSMPTLTNISNVRFTGDPAAVLTCPAGSDRVLLQVVGGRDITFEGLRIVMPVVDKKHYYYGLQVIDVAGLTVTDCTFTGGASGLRVESRAGSSRVAVSNCSFSGGTAYPGADKAAAALVVGGGCDGVTIVGNTISGYREEGIAVDAQASGAARDPWVRNVLVHDNQVSRCGRNGINLRKVKSATVTSNTVSTCGNSADSQLADGINVHTEEAGALCEDITISSNVVRGCEAGIGVDDCLRFTVTGNRISGTTRAWVLHQGLSSQNLVSESLCGSGVISTNTVGAPKSGWPAITVTHGARFSIVGNSVDLTGSLGSPAVKVDAPAAEVWIDTNTVRGAVDGVVAFVTSSIRSVKIGSNRVL